jgi:hypothetical protein
MRRWLPHALLPVIQCSQQRTAPQAARTIKAIRRQSAADVLRSAGEIIHLTGVSHAEALLSFLEEIHANSSLAGAEGRQRFSHRAGVGWLTADQLAERLDHTLHSTNQCWLLPAYSSATRTTTGSSQKRAATGVSPCRSAVGASAASRSSGIHR